MKRLAPRWHHAGTWLDDFAIISWVVDREAVAAVLPDGVNPIERAGGTLISAVAFRDRDFHFRFASWPRLSCGQVNYRAYVTFQGQPGVWFFTTALDSMLVRVPRTLWQMPWRRVSIDISSSGQVDALDSWNMTCNGGGGNAKLSLVGTRRPLAVPTGFADRADADELFDPINGWYERSSEGSIGHYSVWHEPLVLEEAELAGTPDVSVFEDLGLMDSARFHSAGVQRSVFFEVHTPPTKA